MGPDGTATGELREFEAFAPVLALAGELQLYLGIATGGEPGALAVRGRARDGQGEGGARGWRIARRMGITSMVNMDGNRYTWSCCARWRPRGG